MRFKMIVFYPHDTYTSTTPPRADEPDKITALYGTTTSTSRGCPSPPGPTTSP